MHKPVHFLTIIFLLFAFAACKQQVAGPTAAAVAADTLSINKLITKGQDVKMAKYETLPQLAQTLDSLSIVANYNYGRVYANIFRAYNCWYGTNYSAGMTFALKALTDAEKWKVYKPIPEIYSIMANMHKENGNYPEAFKDCANGLAQAKANADTAEIILMMGNRAMFTHSYYNTNRRQQDDHSSLQMEFEALQMAELNPKYEKMRIKFYNNIAQTYNEKKEFDNALLYAGKAVQLAKKYNQQRSLTYAYDWMGAAYYYMGQQAKGMAYIDTGIAITKKMNLPFREMELYDTKYWCYFDSKKYEEAITALNKKTKMRDSLQIAKNERQISELQLKYESVKKDQQIVTLDVSNTEKSRKITWIVVSLGFFALLLVVILYQYYVIHMNNRLMKANNDKLNDALLKIAHIQSHQIRRPLASILGLMNIIKAQDYYAGKDVLERMDAAAHDLDKRIRQVIKETEVVDEWLDDRDNTDQ